MTSLRQYCRKKKDLNLTWMSRKPSSCEMELVSLEPVTHITSFFVHSRSAVAASSTAGALVAASNGMTFISPIFSDLGWREDEHLMDWMAMLATAIAFLRLALICCGMWLLLRSTTRTDFQNNCFAASGVIYLLGLLPQSLLLLINSDYLDDGELCGSQNVACLIAVALHNIIVLFWMVDCTRAQSRTLKYILAFYVLVLNLGRGFFLRRDDGQRFYTDIASKSNAISYWTIYPVEHPSRVIRLQLLLCESSISGEEVWSFVLVSYIFSLLPMGVLYFVCPRHVKDLEEDSQKAVGPDRSLLLGSESGKPNGSHGSGSTSVALSISSTTSTLVQDEGEKYVQRLLSTIVTVWFCFIQPIVFSLQSHHFVDFGTHLLLTICVFTPWTLSEKANNVN